MEAGTEDYTLTPAQVMELYHRESASTLNCLRALPTTIILMMTKTHPDGTPWWQRVEFPDRSFTYKSKIDFVRSNSRGGLGMTVEVLTNMLDSAAELVSRADVEKARRLIFEAEDVIPHKPGPNGDNVSISQHGNSAEYLRRRLKRDAPALWEDVVSGVKSARAAAIEAGIVKVKTPVEVATASLAKLTDEEFATVVAIEWQRRGLANQAI
jgi:hypothetical protein